MSRGGYFFMITWLDREFNLQLSLLVIIDCQLKTRSLSLVFIWMGNALSMEEETTYHLFFLCPIYATVWTFVLSWMNHYHNPRSSLEELTWITPYQGQEHQKQVSKMCF
ncbi:unnamed protein product [Lupinus luteus]|uniref:Uncharacterized protein n=1 Tax=Lupinus luteus TaxID=3873 RepID=A0AAV1YLC4_LUPLU